MASTRAGNRMVVAGFFVPRPRLFLNQTVFIVSKNILSYTLLGIDQGMREIHSKQRENTRIIK